MSEYFTTSFADYYDIQEDLRFVDRLSRIEDLMILTGLAEGLEEVYDLLGYINLREMAATATYQGKEYWNTPKVPLFMDKADIYYLRQFPPMFWKQALSNRYNNLIIDTHQKRTAGESVPDWQWIELRRGQTFRFFVDTGANALYDKLTQQMDVDALRQMSHADRETYEGGNKKYWNFQFDDPVLLDIEDEMKRAKGEEQQEASGKKKPRKKSAQPVWVTKDFVGVGEFTAEKRLDQWLSGIAEGWLGKTGAGTMRQSDNWGGGGKKQRIIHSPEWIAEFVDAWRRRMKIALYESYLAQEREIAAGKRRTRTLSKRLIEDLLIEHDGKGGVIWKAMRPDGRVYTTRPYPLPVLLPGKLVDSRAKQKHDRYMSAADQVREALSHQGKDDLESDSKLKHLLYQMKGKKLMDFVEGESSDLRDEVGRLKPEVLERRLDVLARAESILAVKYWLKENGVDVDAVDHGKISGNPELKKMIRRKLAEFILYAKRRAGKIKQSAPRYDAWDYALGDHNDAYDRLYHTTGFGTIHPNRQQKMQMMDNPDDWWKILVYYFGQATEINGKPVVLPFSAGNVDERHNLPRVAKYWSDKSAIRLGIEGALNSEIVQRHVPEWVALNNSRGELFQAINQWMMFQTGHGTFRNFLDAYQQGEPEELEATGKALRSRIRTMSRNFVLSLFQLDLTGRGSVRTRKRAMASLDAPAGDNAELGDFLANQENDLQDIAKELRPAQYRRTRPESSGASMRVGHSIQVVRAQTKAMEIARRSAPELGAAYEKLAAKLTGDLTRFIIYRNLYIYDQRRQNKKWTMDAANKYAIKMLQQEAESMASAAGYGTEEERERVSLQRKVEMFDRFKEVVEGNITDDLSGLDKFVKTGVDKIGDMKRSEASAQLLALRKHLTDEGLEKIGRNLKVDPESARTAIEFILYYFGKEKGPYDRHKELQSQVSPQQQAQLDRTFLQTFAISLVGDNFSQTGQVPTQTVASIAQETDGATYRELRDYQHSKKLGNINLSRHPEFLKILDKVLAAVDAHLQKTGVQIGGSEPEVGLGGV